MLNIEAMKSEYSSKQRGTTEILSKKISVFWAVVLITFLTAQFMGSSLPLCSTYSTIIEDLERADIPGVEIPVKDQPPEAGHGPRMEAHNLTNTVITKSCVLGEKPSKTFQRKASIIHRPRQLSTAGLEKDQSFSCLLYLLFSY